MAFRIAITRVLRTPVFAQAITPDLLKGLSLSEVENLEINVGNRISKVKDIFAVSEVESEYTLVLSGDFSHVRFIGHRMREGSILLDGKAGPYLGDSMKGGNILVMGDTDSWLGAKMLGGRIEVHGNSGDFVGAAHRGSTKGMKGGEIRIEGSAGSWIGFQARGGLLWIEGDVGMLPGMHMSSGELYVGGACAGMPGAEMTKGKLAVVGHVSSILPGFSYERTAKPKIGGNKMEKKFYQFRGDLSQGGTGRLYVGVEANPHLDYIKSL